MFFVLKRASTYRGMMAVVGKIDSFLFDAVYITSGKNCIIINVDV